jgi:hypothetical protein
MNVTCAFSYLDVDMLTAVKLEGWFNMPKYLLTLAWKVYLPTWFDLVKFGIVETFSVANMKPIGWTADIEYLGFRPNISFRGAAFQQLADYL